MIYYTGDIHGSPANIVNFCQKNELGKNNTIVILGDVGANYFCDKRDNYIKEALSKLLPTIFCIHGNHEARPEIISSYIAKEWNGGSVWYEEKYPNLLFAKDGDIYEIESIKHLVIGGAYSVDKFYRLSRGYNWWKDEQPSEEIKRYVESQIEAKTFDIVLSHTCPFKYEPVEMFLPGIDQNSVDTSTEKWLDIIEDAIDYKAWFCGHWHINKRINKIHFLFHGFESSAQFKGGE